MLFQKKKKGDVPIEEIQKLTARGMSDKDIIKKLKSEGYSYDSIERAMLQAVKEGVNEPEREPEVPSFPEIAPQQQRREPESLFPEFEQMQEVPELETINPEVIVEELIEGVVEDKWNKFLSRIEKVENELNIVRAEIKGIPRNMQQGSAKDFEVKVSELSDQFDELAARVGGLEKAFKQFLPSLTRNIEALSNMIHEMKEKQGMPEKLLG